MPLHKVIILEDPLNIEARIVYDTDDVLATIKNHFAKWPTFARIYHNTVAHTNDITPHNEDTIQHITTLTGTFWIVVYPGEPISLSTLLINVLLFSAAAAASYLLRETPSSTAVAASSDRNIQSTSSNNSLSSRQNSIRLNSRVPDIFGTVRSIPDLLAIPYKVFENHREVEYSYMCIGRGTYDVSDLRDDTTPLTSISGASAEVYAPYTSPNSGDTPQLSVGGAIDTPVYTTKRIDSVDGQILRAPNSSMVNGSSNIKFVYPDSIEHSAGSGLDFTAYFATDDVIVVTNAEYTGIRTEEDPIEVTVDLAGSYTVLSVTTDTIVLSSPSAVNSDWTVLGTLDVTETDLISPSIASSYDKYTTTVFMSDSTVTTLIANFVAVNGSYKDNGKQQYAVNVEVELEATPVDAYGVPTGSPSTYVATVEGSSITRDERAVTIWAELPAPGRYNIRARRITETDTAFVGTVVDTVQFRDLYTASEVDKLHFGDVTTVQTITYATLSALSVKSRKFNCLVTRKVPARLDDNTFTTTLFASNSADDIISFICLDPLIGRRSLQELDVAGIYDTIESVAEYFGTSLVTEFCYTFDKDQLSFEETLASVASAVFCTAYRRGSTINLSFDKATSMSTLLLNHRNKIPNTEARNVTFGNVSDYDGVDLQYVDYDDISSDDLLIIHIPEDLTAVNPKRVETIGVRNRLQAYFHAMRAYNRILHTHITVSCDCTQESNILVLNDKILIADNTRQDTIDGDILAQDGLALTLSQDIVLDPDASYTLFIQYYDGTVGTIDFAQVDTNIIVLATAPMLPLITDVNAYSRTTFMIANDSTDMREFTVTSKEPQSNFTVKITANNYDSRYYANDTDYINDIVDSNGYLL